MLCLNESYNTTCNGFRSGAYFCPMNGEHPTPSDFKIDRQ